MLPTQGWAYLHGLVHRDACLLQLGGHLALVLRPVVHHSGGRAVVLEHAVHQGAAVVAHRVRSAGRD